MPKAKIRSRVAKKSLGPEYSLKDAVRAMRKAIQAAKRHARTDAAARIRQEFMVAMGKVASKAARLHESGRIDDGSLSFIAEGAESHFGTAQMCAYNRRRPGHALPGFDRLQDYRDHNSPNFGEPVNDSARKILEAGKSGYFDRLMGKDNPYAEDTAPDTTARTTKRPAKTQRTRKPRKQASHA